MTLKLNILSTTLLVVATYLISSCGAASDATHESKYVQCRKSYIDYTRLNLELLKNLTKLNSTVEPELNYYMKQSTNYIGKIEKAYNVNNCTRLANERCRILEVYLHLMKGTQLSQNTKYDDKLYRSCERNKATETADLERKMSAIRDRIAKARKKIEEIEALKEDAITRNTTTKDAIIGNTTANTIIRNTTTNEILLNNTTSNEVLLSNNKSEETNLLNSENAVLVFVKESIRTIFGNITTKAEFALNTSAEVLLIRNGTDFNNGTEEDMDPVMLANIDSSETEKEKDDKLKLIINNQAPHTNDSADKKNKKLFSLICLLIISSYSNFLKMEN